MPSCPALAVLSNTSRIVKCWAYCPVLEENERQRRGCGEKLLIKGENTNLKRPADWKLFLRVTRRNSSGSSAMYIEKVEGREVIIVCEGIAHHLSSEDGKTTSKELPEIGSTQEKTDTRVVLYCKHADNQGYKFACINT